MLFSENSFKKFSNDSSEKGRKNEIKESNKDYISNNNISNDKGINVFELGDEDNLGSMLNESDGFDKLIDQLKIEKIEDDKSYEKQRKQKVIEKEKEIEKAKLKQDEYDIDNLMDNLNNNNTNEKFENNIYDKGPIFENKDINDINFSNNEIKNNKNSNHETKNKHNRRGNARQFLEETDNGGFNLYNGFNENIMKKNSEPIRNFNLGNSGEFGSLFGNKSRRKHDNKNYEI
jgi:hypothetical protein